MDNWLTIHRKTYAAQINKVPTNSSIDTITIEPFHLLAPPKNPAEREPFDEKEVAELITAIGKNKNIHKVEFSFQPLTTTSINALCTMLAKRKDIVVLECIQCEINDESAKLLAELLALNPLLTMNLSANHIGKLGQSYFKKLNIPIQSWGSSLEANKRINLFNNQDMVKKESNKKNILRQLEQDKLLALNLNYPLTSSKLTIDEFNALCQALEKSCKLEKISLFNMGLGDEMIALLCKTLIKRATTLQDCKPICELNLTSNNITDKCLLPFAKLPSEGLTLILFGNKLSNAARDYFANFGGNELNLLENPMDDNVLSTLQKGARSIFCYNAFKNGKKILGAFTEKGSDSPMPRSQRKNKPRTLKSSLQKLWTFGTIVVEFFYPSTLKWLLRGTQLFSEETCDCIAYKIYPVAASSLVVYTLYKITPDWNSVNHNSDQNFYNSKP